MQRRRQRCQARRHRFASDEDSDTASSGGGSSESESRAMRCVSCEERYDARDGGTCKECYHEANDTEEELKSQIDDLKSKLSFLRLENHNPSFSDVVLVASTPSSSSAPIPAHKAVLVSRSAVLRAMLESEMEEARSGTIKIRDVSYEALRAFVDYMYTAEACLDDQLACELLVLADKYEVNHLKSHCQSFLVSRLNLDNSVPTYAFAHQHNAPLLLHAALSHITDNLDKLTLTEEYLLLKAKDPRLVVDIFEAYLSKQLNTAAPNKDSSSSSSSSSSHKS